MATKKELPVFTMPCCHKETKIEVPPKPGGRIKNEVLVACPFCEAHLLGRLKPGGRLTFTVVKGGVLTATPDGRLGESLFMLGEESAPVQITRRKRA